MMPGPSFYKILIGDFACKLELPHAFVQKYEELLPDSGTLRINSEETWNVKLEETEHGLYCFTRGWSKFVNDVKLKVGDFVVFCFNIVELIFDVSAFGTSGFHKKVSAADLKNDGKQHMNYICPVMMTETSVDKNKKLRISSKSVETGTRATGSSRGNLTFTKLLNKGHFKDRMYIPKGFGIESGRKILVQDERGKKWSVKVTGRRNGRNCAITAGLKAFLMGNNLIAGNTICFEFIPGSSNVIQARVIKQPQPSNPPLLPSPLPLPLPPPLPAPAIHHRRN